LRFGTGAIKKIKKKKAKKKNNRHWLSWNRAGLDRPLVLPKRLRKDDDRGSIVSGCVGRKIPDLAEKKKLFLGVSTVEEGSCVRKDLRSLVDEAPNALSLLRGSSTEKKNFRGQSEVSSQPQGGLDPFLFKLTMAGEGDSAQNHL